MSGILTRVDIESLRLPAPTVTCGCSSPAHARPARRPRTNIPEVGDKSAIAGDASDNSDVVVKEFFGFSPERRMSLRNSDPTVAPNPIIKAEIARSDANPVARPVTIVRRGQPRLHSGHKYGSGTDSESSRIQVTGALTAPRPQTEHNRGKLCE